MKVERDLSWVIDEYAKLIHTTIDPLESARPRPTYYEAVSDGQVVADSPDDFGERGGLKYLGDSPEPFTGVIKRWWSGENLRSEMHYVEGRLHGSYKKWLGDDQGHLQGQVLLQGQMVDGQRDGQWFERTGMRIVRVCYRMDERIACE